MCWALAHWPAMRMLSKPAPSGGKEADSGKGVSGRGSSTFKARKLRVTSGQPWADVGRGFAVAMTHGKASSAEETWRKEVLRIVGFTAVAGEKTQERVKDPSQRKTGIQNSAEFLTHHWGRREIRES